MASDCPEASFVDTVRLKMSKESPKEMRWYSGDQTAVVAKVTGGSGGLAFRL